VAVAVEPAVEPAAESAAEPAVAVAPASVSPGEADVLVHAASGRGMSTVTERANRVLMR
jgi:hypothetical protein